MKKLTLAIIIAFAAVFALAQGPGGRPGGQGGRRGFDPKTMVANMKKALNLNAGQEKKLMAIMESRKVESDKLRAAPGDRKSKGPQMKKMREAFEAKVKGILTKEQAVKYDKMMAEMRAKFGGGRGGPGGGRGPGGPPKGGGI